METPTSKTSLGITKSMYAGAVTRSRKKTRKVSFTLQQFSEFLSKNKKFKVLYREWVESGFNRRLTPSIDRIDNTKGYELKNIQIMTTYENLLKGDHKYVPGLIKLKEKRDELIWALDYQGYNGSEIGMIFNINRSTVFDAKKLKPKNYRPKWIKAR